MKHYQVIIIGAGAAGLMCALTAGQRGRKVLLLEHNDQIGNKILISGGGHCNFTNLFVESDNYVSGNPKFPKPALSRFSPYSFTALLEKYNIPYQEKKNGQLFLKGKSKEIVNLLQEECRKYRVEIKTNCKIGEISKKRQFLIKTSLGDYTSDSLVIATGGLSMPAVGASDFGYKVAEQFGLNIISTHPALVPLTFDNKHFRDLAGISVNTAVTCNRQTFYENILFTHKGLSGPAILQISNYWNKSNEIIINLLPDINLAEIIEKRQKERPKAELKNLISEFLPKRLVQKWLELNKPPVPVSNRSGFGTIGGKPCTTQGIRVNQYNKKEISRIADIFHKWRIIPFGTEGYRAAEVTGGGVDTRELSSKTFECHKIKGLYFIGEVLDVTGQLGGYNLHWAWASGYSAGQFV